MKWDISKDFHLEYGHSVWSQQLNKELCSRDDTQCACRHLHGHSGKVTIHLQSDNLERGMVTDFKHLGFMKDFIDDNLDHKFIIDSHDPGFKLKVGMDYDGLVLKNIKMNDVLIGQVIDINNSGISLTSEEIEFYESFFIVDFLPTSENLAKYIFEVSVIKLKDIVSGVDWQETVKSIARYRK